jgi:PDZ domain-containing protein
VAGFTPRAPHRLAAPRTVETTGVEVEHTTTEPMLPAPAPPQPLRARRWPFVAVVLLVVLALVVGVGGTAYHLDEYALSPGDAIPVTGPHGLIVLPPGRAHPVRGAVLLTDVTLSPVPAIDWVFDKLNPQIALVPAREILGNLSPSQLGPAEAVQMVASQQAATVVALHRLGYRLSERNGALVVEVLPASPAARAGVALGDVVEAVDGSPTPTAASVGSLVRAHPPGSTVELTLQPLDGTPPRTVTVRLAASPSDPTAGFLGVGVTNGAYFALPFPVRIRSDGIGGPSAGLAFTLGLLDELSTGDLTGGRVVAATGVIGFHGRVHSVGGVAQKTIAVRRAGATVFLVPPAEYRDALREAGPRLHVVAVANLDQALAALGRFGGDVAALPPAPSSTLSAGSGPSG